MSGSDNKKKIIPIAPVLPAVVPGNLLSSIAPPSELPNFVTAPVLQVYYLIKLVYKTMKYLNTEKK